MSKVFEAVLSGSVAIHAHRAQNVMRAETLTRPRCEPYQRIYPLALPGVRPPATCSALRVKIVSSVWI
jgi:hypothetical protein